VRETVGDTLGDTVRYTVGDNGEGHTVTGETVRETRWERHTVNSSSSSSPKAAVV
jgi:hypothetical protein